MKMPSRDSIVRFLQYVNRHTGWLGGLKRFLGLHRLAERCLVRSLSDEEIRRLRGSIREDIVTRQIEALAGQGVDEIHFYILLVMSMGDIVAAEPIVRSLKAMAPKGRVHWIVGKKFAPLISGNPYIDEVLPVESLAVGVALATERGASAGNILVNCHFDGTAYGECGGSVVNLNNPQVGIYNYYYLGCLLSNFCFAAGLPEIVDAPQFFIEPEIASPLRERAGYVVVHCRSNGIDRNWVDEKWNALARTLVKRNLTVVEIGTERVLDASLGAVDYTGYKDLQKVATIVNDARLLVGVDSVFAHVANALRVPAVVILGKFMNYESYFPYSGDFCKSNKFRVVRAPKGKPASAVCLEDVISAADSILGG